MSRAARAARLGALPAALLGALVSRVGRKKAKKMGPAKHLLPSLQSLSPYQVTRKTEGGKGRGEEIIGRVLKRGTAIGD